MPDPTPARSGFPRHSIGPGMLTAALLLAGCGSDGGGATGPMDDFGSFSVTVSGDLSTSASGEIVFHTGDIDPTWAVSMGSTEVSLTIVRTSGRPGAGTYNLTTEDGENYALVGAQAGGVNFSGESVSGTLTITASSPSRVTGTFSFTAVSFIDELEIVVTGSFEAVTQLSTL